MTQAGTIAWLLTSVAVLSATQATARVQFKQNRLNQTIEISGLFSDPTCTASRSFDGTAVKRDFADDGVTITAVVVERNDGTRGVINVEIPSGLDMATGGGVYDGLQRLFRQGRTVHGRARECGNAPVLVLEQVW